MRRRKSEVIRQYVTDEQDPFRRVLVTQQRNAGASPDHGVHGKSLVHDVVFVIVAHVALCKEPRDLTHRQRLWRTLRRWPDPNGDHSVANRQRRAGNQLRELTDRLITDDNAGHT